MSWLWVFIDSTIPHLNWCYPWVFTFKFITHWTSHWRYYNTVFGWSSRWPLLGLNRSHQGLSFVVTAFGKPKSQLCYGLVPEEERQCCSNVLGCSNFLVQIEINNHLLHCKPLRVGAIEVFFLKSYYPYYLAQWVAYRRYLIHACWMEGNWIC